MTIHSKMTSKGQTTIPLEIRQLLKLKPGDRVHYLIEDGAVRLLAKNKPAADLLGILGPPPYGAGATLADMDEAIGLALAEDDARIVRQWNEMKDRQ